jgi:hypothetical protein
LIQRVVGKDLENLRGSSKSSLGCYAVFWQSFGVGSFESRSSGFLVRSLVAHKRSARWQTALVGSQVTVGPLVGQ